jgi:hypothetical protein
LQSHLKHFGTTLRSFRDRFAITFHHIKIDL